MRFDMVIFDCDGVVVDSEPLTNAVLRDDLAARGLDLTLAQVMDEFVGGTMAAVGQQAAQMGAEIPGDWLDQVYAKIYAHLAENVEAVPGIATVLDRLDAAGIPYAIGSNGSRRKMEITLGRTGLYDRFAGKLYSGQEIPNPKPAPDVYLLAAREAGVMPDRCAVIEDSASGAKATKAAGMTCFGFIAETPPAKLAQIADHLFKDMAALPDLLGV